MFARSRHGQSIRKVLVGAWSFGCGKSSEQKIAVVCTQKQVRWEHVSYGLHTGFSNNARLHEREECRLIGKLNSSDTARQSYCKYLFLMPSSRMLSRFGTISM